MVHAHKFTSSTWSALLVSRTRVPLLAHEHNWSGGRDRLRALIYRHLIGRVAFRTICVSESVERTVLGDGVAPERVLTIPNAVVPDVAFERARARELLGIDQDAPTIGIVAGLRPEKAHEVALDALADARLAAAGVRLCVIGTGPREAALRAYATAVGVEDRVDWLGAVDDQWDAAISASISAGGAFSGAFDAALVCSDWEGLPLFSLEAMMAGTPLIATRVGELERLCRQEAGWLVPTRDSEALADAMWDVVDEPAATARRAARGQHRVRAQHSFPVLMARLERLYLEALGEPHATSIGALSVEADADAA